MNKTIAHLLLTVSGFSLGCFGTQFIFDMLCYDKVNTTDAWLFVLSGATFYVAINYIFDRWE